VEDTSAAGVATALRAVRILEEIAEAGRPLTLTEIAAAVDVSMPTARRLLKALESRDLIVADSEPRGYVLGFGIMQLARVILDRDDLIAASAPALERLRTESGETVSLQRLVDDQRVPVAELLSPHSIRMMSGVGTPYPLDRGAAGKAILAFLADYRIERLTAVSSAPQGLRQELDAVRRRGWAISAAEVVPGARSVAAPILDFTGGVCASLNVTGPVERFTEQVAVSLAPTVVEIAAGITHLLGGDSRQEAAE